MAKDNSNKRKGSILVLVIVLIVLLLALAAGAVWALDYFGIVPLHTVPVVGQFVQDVADPLAGEKARLSELESALDEQEAQLLDFQNELRQKEADLVAREHQIQEDSALVQEEKSALLELQAIDEKLQQIADIYASMMSSQAANSMRHVDNGLLTELIARMPAEQAASIIAKLPEQKAASLTKAMGNETDVEQDPEQEQIVSMAEMYSKMEPTVAAESIQVLEGQLAARILAEMTPENSMQILSVLPPQTASQLIGVMAGQSTEELDQAKERQLHSLAQLYSGLDTQQAVASLESIDEALAVNILQRLSQADVQRLFDNLSTFKVARLVARMADEDVSELDAFDPYGYNAQYVASLVSKMTPAEAAKVFDGMDKALVSEVFKELSPEQAKDVLVALPQADAAEVMLNLSGALSQYDEFKQNERLQQLVDIYTSMDVEQVAVYLQRLDDDETVVALLGRMEPELVGSVVAALPQTVGVKWSKMMVDSYSGGSQGRHTLSQMFSVVEVEHIADMIVNEMDQEPIEIASIINRLTEEKAGEIITAVKELDDDLAVEILLAMGE